MYQTRKNYSAFYDERKHAIVAVPRTRSIPKYLVSLFFFCLGVMFIPGALLYGAHRLFSHLFDWDPQNLPGGYLFWSSFTTLMVIVFLIVELSPRLGFFPGAFGGKLILSKSSVDRKLAKLIKKHPFKLNVDWFPQWAEAKTLSEQERIFSDLKEAVRGT